MKHRVLCLLLPAVLVWGGCATPSRRIERNPEVFNALTAEQQEMVRNQQIDVGFTADMVRLAWGEPARTAVRKTAAAVQEIWSYRALEAGGWGPRYPYYGYYPPYGRWPHDSTYYGYPVRTTTYERGRVVFTDGVVSEFQHVDQP